MFSLPGEDQKNYCGGPEQSFLSGVPACAAQSKAGAKENETCRASTRVEEVVPFFNWHTDG